VTKLIVSGYQPECRVEYIARGGLEATYPWVVYTPRMIEAVSANFKPNRGDTLQTKALIIVEEIV
jgi:hypothetical protein